MPHHQAADYRRRATQLRTLAARLENTPSMSLHLHAGVDTWYGPRPDACLTELARARQAVRDAADELQVRAVAFDRLADDLETAAIRAERAAEVRETM